MNVDLKSEFDREQIERLQPLADLDAFVRVPLFANTLPLGYHYAAARGATKGIDEAPRVGLIPWGVPPLAQIVNHADENGAPAVFYCTMDYRQKIAEVAGVPDLVERLVYIPVTQYRPRWVFVRSTVHLRESGHVGSHATHNPTLEITRDIADFLTMDSRWCEIYTDTPDQASSLSPFLEEKLDREVRVVDANERDALLGPQRPHRALELLYFSAPVTSGLRTDRRYVSLRLPEQAVQDQAAEDFATGVAILPGKYAGDSEIKAISVAIRDYHAALYDRCVNADPNSAADSFAEIIWAYNRLARAQRVGDTFASEMQYAECIADHHLAPTTA
jgi:hypothetical protein